MSRVFDALKRVQGDVAETIVPIVETPRGAAAEGVEPVVPSPPPVLSQSDHRGFPKAGLPDVRTLPLRIAAASPILPFDVNQSHASEQYRIARTRIVQHPTHPRVIVISSAGAGDGKSITAINIAGAMALKSERVLLMDADFRRSSTHAHLGLPDSPGLAEVLTGSCTLEEALVRVEQFQTLFVLAAGAAKSNPAELLDNPAWPALIARVREWFDYVIVDSPPMAAVADYDLIQAPSDGLLLVARPDHTSRRLCLKALEDASKDKLIGVLLNCMSNWFMAKYQSADYYYYSEVAKGSY